MLEPGALAGMRTEPRRDPQPVRVRIVDVADRLGLTKGTVSRALNGYSDIADSTRLRVLRAAEAMGYRPLSHAQAIRTGRTRSLGLVLQMNVHDAQRPFLADFLSGVTGAVSRESWTLTVATAESEADTLATLARLVDERKADGFILPRTLTDDARIELLRGAGVPFVLYGRTGDPEGCAWYDILGETAMQAAVARLAAAGHRRIGFVGGGAEYNYSRMRLAGYRAGLRAAGLAEDPALVHPGALTRDEGAAATATLLRLDHPPTALIFAVDMAALGAWPVAERLGLRLGDDLSVISYDGIPEGAWVQPGLTTFRVDTRAAGARLAALLIRRIRGEPPEALRETANAALVPRGSDGPPRLPSQDLARHVRAAENQSKGGYR